MDQYKVLEGEVLIAIDGVWFQSSEKVYCSHCLHISHKGKTRYYQSMVAAAIVRPGGEVVVPPAPEMIGNEEQPQHEGKSRVQKGYEEQKQDCKRGVAQRLLEKQGEYYKTLNATR